MLAVLTFKLPSYNSIERTHNWLVAQHEGTTKAHISPFWSSSLSISLSSGRHAKFSLFTYALVTLICSRIVFKKEESAKG